ncbi:phosphoenolpyruvate carboxykinase (ATP) [Rubrivivax gelatinosus]|uniref:HPr kinase/phosphorylase C-terminal domain-containing protein n=1 Tax=Rubrivivax gelatinosus TaxID=28068 RepID=A0ABS1DYQ6_RUBGE|nr:hypothetical protein [Rubrivivax gelatinosus]MBK1714514.1 hypothetical protein [Rubrivivax gelatinosus]
MNYRCYGLTIASELTLPELAPADAAAAAADVTIRRAAVAPGGLPGGRQIGPFLWTTDEALWLQVPGVARFLVQDGCEIRIDAADGADDDSLRVFLLGSAFGALLTQRGHLVLHGNALRVGDACMVCVGPSGAGKSTLAAALLQRGHELVADDVVPVDDEGRALPGFPRVKLWQDAAERLGIATEGLRRVRPPLAKFSLPAPGRGARLALPVRWIYILNSHPAEEVTLRALQGHDRFRPLLNNTYRLRFLDGAALKGRHLQQCGQLASLARVVLVHRPQLGFDIDGLAERLLADVQAHPLA